MAADSGTIDLTGTRLGEFCNGLSPRCRLTQTVAAIRDFLLYTRDPIANPEGEFKGRILYKQFEGRPDIVREYQRFQSEVLGRQWVIPPHAPLENDMDPGFVAQPRL